MAAFKEAIARSQ